MSVFDFEVLSSGVPLPASSVKSISCWQMFTLLLCTFLYLVFIYHEVLCNLICLSFVVYKEPPSTVSLICVKTLLLLSFWWIPWVAISSPLLTCRLSLALFCKPPCASFWSYLSPMKFVFERWSSAFEGEPSGNSVDCRLNLLVLPPLVMPFSCDF